MFENAITKQNKIKFNKIKIIVFYYYYLVILIFNNRLNNDNQ